MKAQLGVGSRVSRAGGSIKREGIRNRKARVEVVRPRSEYVAAAVIRTNGNDRLPLVFSRVSRLDCLSEDRFHRRPHAVADQEDAGGKAQKESLREGRGLDWIVHKSFGGTAFSVFRGADHVFLPKK